MSNFTVSSGQTSTGLTLNSGDTEIVLSGGLSVDTTIQGGTETVSSGGSDGGTTISSGSETVESGGTASGVTILGGTLDVSGGTVDGIVGSNAGTITLENGALLVTSGGFVNSGALDVDVFNAEGGSNLTIGGTLTNTGAATIGVTNLSAATNVTASSLVNTGVLVLQGNAASGTTEQASLDIAGAAPAVVSGTIAVRGDADLEFAGTGISGIAGGAILELIGAQARISLGADTSSTALSGLTSNAGTFYVLGDDGTGAGGAVVTTTVGLVNSGTLDVDVFNAEGGSNLTIGGTLTNTGAATIGVTNLSAPTNVTASSLANTGSLVLQGNAASGTTEQASLDIAGAAPAVVSGTIAVRGDADLEFAGTGISGIAGGAILELIGAQARISLGADTSSTALSGLTSNAGTFYVLGDDGTGAGGAVVTTTVGLVNSGTLDVDVFNAEGGSNLTIGGTLTNTGAATIGVTNLSAPTNVTASSLANTGSLVLQGNAASGTTEQASLDIAGAAPAVVSGTIAVRGDADLEFAGTGISGIAGGATLELIGAQARISLGADTSSTALSGLTSNAGTFYVLGDDGTGAGGAVVTTTVGLVNSGALDVDVFNAEGGSNLTIGGTLTNAGAATIGVTNLSAPTNVTASSLANTGSLVLQGNAASGTTEQASLDIAGAAPAVVSGTIAVRGDADLEFAGTGISGIAGGATLELIGAQARISLGADTSSTALSGLTSNAGTFYVLGDDGTGAGGAVVTTTVGLVNSGTLDVDVFNAEGGSNLTIGGTLTNTGAATIGVTNLSAPTNVTASSLANTGSLVLQGNAASGTTEQASLDIAGAAPAVVSGTIAVRGDADLEFAGTGISGIAGGAILELIGAQARISLGADTSSTALSGLTSNAGTFYVLGDDGTGAGGAVVTTTVGLVNSGTLDVDVFNAEGGSNLTIGGTLTNTGAATIGVTNLSAATNVTASSLANTGSLVLQGNAASGTTEQASLDIAGAAPASVSGFLAVRGDADLEFAGTGISGIAGGATLELIGAQARISLGADTSSTALSGLTSNAGTFYVLGDDGTGAGGAVVATTVGLVNSGTLDVDVFNAEGGSTLTIGGALTNIGSATIGVVNLAASTTVAAAGLVNTGVLVLQGNATSGTTEQATLDIAGAAPASVSGFLSMRGDADLEFGGTGISSIAGGATLQLIGAQARVSLGAATSSTALAGLTSNAGTFQVLGDDPAGGGGAVVTTAAGFVNSGTLDVDFGNGQGGSTLTIGGVLTNTGAATIGVANLSAPTVVTAAGLVNTGRIALTGKAAGPQATLNLTGPGTAGGSIGVNTGTISSNANGIAVNVAARFVNGSSGSGAGLITALYDGVVLSGGGSLTNYGTITGTQVGAYLEPAGSVPGAGVLLTNFGLVAGATGIVDGGPTGILDTIVNYGTIAGTGGAGITLGRGTDRVVDFGTISGANGAALAFGGGSGLVVVEPGAVLAATLAGFGVLDTIDLAKVQATGTMFSGTTLAGTLSVLNGTAVVESLVLSGQFAGKAFALSPDGQGGVDINLRAPLGNVIPGTYGFPIILTGANASTTVTATGSIAASLGDGVVNAVGVVGTLTNMGRVTAAASGSDGVYFGAGGLVTNGVAGSAGGYISGAGAGVRIGGATGTVVNTGTITGGSGIVIDNATLTTITNAGTIIGTTGPAVSLGGGNNRLIVDPGAAFAGTLDGGGGASVLEIAALSGGSGGSGPGRGQGSVAYVSLGSVTNFSALQIDPSATLDGSGALSFATLINEGQVVVGSGDALALGDVAAAANTGVIDLRTGATVDFEGPVANQILAFNPAGGSAKIDQPAEFAGTIADFTASLDTIDLTSLVFAGNTSVGFTPATDALTVVQGGASATLQLDAEDYTGITWSAAPDAGSGTEIAANPCYCRGTLILTEQGEVAVEDLAIGDRVMTLSGMARPVKWIGRRSYDGRFALGQRHILPVCVKAGALADGVPRRDLWLSPNHALHLEGVLIEARDLINHVSVFQAERVAAIDYFHIELDSHDVILAEGAAAESFIDDDSRLLFHNAHEYRAIYPDGRNGPARYCAPRRDQGYAVERARTRIARRAGLAAAAEVPPPGKLRGQIDEIGRRRISGCAQDAAHPDARSVSTSLPSAT